MRIKSADLVERQIKQAAQKISTESYPMSVGEMISLYKNGEIDLHPDFQRFFRWDAFRKSRFIESLLLGIPIPSIFVSQDDRGKWDIVDGLQRLSTILELTGDLQNEQAEQIEPLQLESTRYIPALQGHTWETLPEYAKFQIKRSKLDLKIVLNKSSAEAKYELFQRLNTGGVIATDQEVRNCILIMLDREFFKWINSLRNYQPFRECIPLSERLSDEQYDLELISRFIVFRNIEKSELSDIGDIGTFLTDKFITGLESQTLNRDEEEAAFKQVFDALNADLGEDAFKKFNRAKGRAEGPILISVFEMIAIGLGHFAGKAKFDRARTNARELHQTLWNNKLFVANTGSGVRGSTRLPVTIPLSRKLLAL